MTKYAINDWADYARGALSEEETAAMRDHLAASASPYERALVSSFERLAETAREERRMTPPAHVVRSAEALFRRQKPESKGLLERLELHLAFDSMLAPAAAGSRSLHDASRQLLYRSDEYALDLRIAYPSDRHGSVVVGQILKRAGAPVDQAPVELMVDGEAAATALTSQYGSFCIESAATPPLELRLQVDGGREIVVDLDPPSESD